ncbi:MAG TPA: hypothetical protein VFG05_07240, partial [Methylocella sp.]|nr:hypothetical protein [Methylocella sp.]
FPRRFMSLKCPASNCGVFRVMGCGCSSGRAFASLIFDMAVSAKHVQGPAALATERTFRWKAKLSGMQGAKPA